MAGVGQFKRATAARWTSVNPTLAAGELGLETDTFKMKIGNGSTNWVGLPYANIGNTGPTGPAGPTGTGLSRTLATTIDFQTIAGENQTVTTTIVDALIKSNSIIFIQVLDEEFLAQNVSCRIVSITDSTNYTIEAIAPDGATGVMNINILIF